MVYFRGTCPINNLCCGHVTHVLAEIVFFSEARQNNFGVAFGIWSYLQVEYLVSGYGCSEFLL